MAAAGRVPTQVPQAAFFALCIAVTTTAPLVVAWISWRTMPRSSLVRALNRSEVPVLGWVTAGFSLYVGVTAFFGSSTARAVFDATSRNKPRTPEVISALSRLTVTSAARQSSVARAPASRGFSLAEPRAPAASG